MSNTILFVEFKRTKIKIIDESISQSHSVYKCAKSSRRNLSKSIIKTCILFVMMTLPNAIVSLAYAYLSQTNEGLLVIRVGDLLSFTFHGFSFFINLFVNRKFRIKVKNFIFCMKKI